MRRAALLGGALLFAACSSPKAAFDKLCAIATEVEADASIPEGKKLERIDARVDKEVSHADVKGTWRALKNVGPDQKMTILVGTAKELGVSSFNCPALEARVKKPLVWKEEPAAPPAKSAGKPRAVMTIVRVEGGVTGTEAVTRAISKDGPAMKACYQKRLEATEPFEGNLTYRETAGDGGMVAFEVENDLLSDPETKACVTEITRGWKVPTASKPEDQMLFELQFRAPEN